MEDYGFPHVLIVTTEWPLCDGDFTGIHVSNQVKCLRLAGLDVDVFHFRGSKNPLAYLKATLDFWKLNLGKYDVIHAHHGQAGFVAIAQRKIPFVVTFHGSDLMGIRNQSGKITFSGMILRLLSKYIGHRATEVIVVAEHLQDYLPRIHCHLIPAGIDTSLFRPIPKSQARQLLALPDEQHLVLFVGNSSRPEKRYWLAEAAIALLKKDLDARLILAQDINPDQMYLYMNACDVLVVTSSNEGSPNAVKEALACNLPIVSTDVGDVKKRIQNIKGCICCEDDSPETIAFSLRLALKDGARINGRETIMNLDEKLLTQQVIAVYIKSLKTGND
jgi:teichuronic acid biosynthesis glycosyltransferase TuaC